MIILTDDNIREYATNEAVFRRGQKYYKQGRVNEFEFYKDLLLVTAKVRGTMKYRPEIFFDKKGKIESYNCDCMAFERYYGACKHIIALLYMTKEYFYKNQFLNTKNYFNGVTAGKEVIQLFADVQDEYDVQIESSKKEKVDLEVIVRLNNYTNYYKYTCFLEFKIGTTKKYMLKPLKNFLKALYNKEAYEFGKKFIFDVNKHYFDEIDQSIIDLIKELYETEKLIEELNFGQSKSLFNNKSINLPGLYVKKFFKLLKNKDFKLYINENEKEHIIIEENMTADFVLSQDKNDLVLESNNNQFPILITDNGEYVYYNNKIYKLSNKQRQYLVPLFQILTKHKGKILFSKEQKERFVSEVLPYTKQIGNIRIEEEVKNNFYQVDLNIEVYMNRYDEGISAEVVFVYGEYKIYPFLPVSKEQRADKIVIRDVQKEKSIIKLFERANFKVGKDKIYLLDEDDIFEFIYIRMPVIQQYAEVFYSDAFKEMNLRYNHSFSGGISVDDNTGMLEFSFKIEDADEEEVLNIFNSLREKKKYFRLKNGSYLPLESEELMQISDIIEYMNVNEEELKKGMMLFPKYRALYIDEKIREKQITNIERNISFKHLVQNVKEPQDVDYQIPDSLSGILRNYQKTGFKWLKTLSSYGFGGILADDMGLGKTLQTIAFIQSEKEHTDNPSIVIAPTSLVYNWQYEIEKFAPSLKTKIISGSKKIRKESMEKIAHADIVITSYALIRRDIDNYKDINFDYCFIDEAQHIKNPISLNAKAVKRIKAKGYFALTGTPLENTLRELWSIFDFVMSGYFLSYKKFLEKYERPIVKNKDEKAMEELTKQIRPFVLRRLKKNVLKELPAKIESKMAVELTDEQKKVYLAYLKKAKGEISREINEKGFNKSHIKIIATLTRLRQICCHPSMFLENYNGESGKMLMLREILKDALQGGHRILLFSQFTSMLKIIKQELIKLQIKYSYLDGSTKAEDRYQYVKKFNEGKDDIFLISLKAGGTGLNLTGADMVIHFDPWWNPAVEDQATDRAYRIGQKNVVQVMKLISQGTIEEKIYELQQKKKNMIDTIIKPGETMLNKLSEQDIKKIFEL